MGRLIEIIGLLYLSVSLMVCAIPRCGMILSTLQNVNVKTTEFSCHDVEESTNDLRDGGISRENPCKCDLLSFISTAPNEPIVSHESITVIEDLLYSTAYRISYDSVSLIPSRPPPKAFVS
ncbi:MAG: hypothetical protein HRU19_21840 [Pseudobacteriovorax sp.]|nr:hypothetical protein [Pseudobacteriovorax sp.]